MRFPKTGKKKYTGLQRGMNLSLACSKFAAKLRLPCPAAAMCTVVINVLEPGAFNPKSQYFIP